MEFSIITPSYNQGGFIEDCIQSVLAQKNHELEHIVIDAGSTDETLAILKKYPHLKWISEPDEGMSDGINKGFAKATGRWLMWLNCDDYLLPGALDKVRHFLERNSSADLVHGDCLFVDEDKKVIRRKYDHSADEWTLFYCGCYIPSTTTFISSRVIEANHFISKQFRVCMDWEYYLRLMRAGFNFAYIAEPLAGFRWHGSNTSLVLESKAKSETKTLRQDHLRLTGRSSILAKPVILHLLIAVFKVVRVIKRYKTHAVLR